MAFVCGGKWLTAGPGTYVFGPRHIPHGFRVLGSAPARLLLLCAPAGFEQFVLDLSEPEPAPGVPPTPPDMTRLMAAAAKYSVDILGPLPEQTGVAGSPAKSDIELIDSVREAHVAAFNARDVGAWVNTFAAGVIYQESITFAKASPSSTLIARLVAVDAEGAERLLGEYTFHHTPTI